MNKKAREKHITLDDGSYLEYVPKDPRVYFHKVNIFYGESNSGKTVVMLEAMKMLSDYIPVWFIISPTNKSNNSYTDRIPPCCIKYTVKIEFLETLYKRQEYLMEIYRQVNRLPVLESLFKRCADSEVSNIVSQIKENAKKKITRVKRDTSLDVSMKKAHMKSINKTLTEYLTAIYKTIIRYHKQKIEKLSNLTVDEAITLKFLDLNPNVGLIFDDTGAEVEKYGKKEVVQKFFYQGRHGFATSFFLYQDDKTMKPGLRRNTPTGVFTTPESATSFFETKTNAHSKTIRQKAILAIKGCFELDKGEDEHYRKLVYQKGKVNPFGYMIANNYEDDDFKVGCEALWEFQRKLPVRSREDTQKSNPFLSQYIYADT